MSPLLANVYLHYVFDRWVRQWRRRHAHGDVVVVRFADDFVVGFEHQDDAQRFLADLRERFAKFGLELHPDKTRLIEFGRFAARNRKARGVGKPETFDFLGFTHICGKSEKRALLVAAHHHLEADAGQAGRGQRPAQAAPASTHPRTGPLAGERRARPPRLLRRARQQQRRRSLPGRGHPALVQGASAPQPAPHASPGSGCDASSLRWLPSARILHPYPACASTLAPKAGAQCGSSARWDLCGGPPARAVPTAKRVSAVGAISPRSAPNADLSVAQDPSDRARARRRALIDVRLVRRDRMTAAVCRAAPT